MTPISRKTSIGLALSAVVSLSGTAHAQVNEISSPSGLSSGDITTNNYTFSNTDVNSPIKVTTSDGKATVTFTDMGGKFHTTRQKDGSYDAVFPSGTGANATLLQTGSGGVSQGPLTITFSKGISEFGFYVEDVTVDKETFTVSALYDGISYLNFSTSQVDNASKATAVFLGGRVGTNHTITQLIISSASTKPGGNNNFVFGAVSMKVAPLVAAPEPSSVGVFSVGLLGLAGALIAARRRGSLAG